MKHVSVSTIIAIFIIGFALLAGRHVAQRNHIIDLAAAVVDTPR